MHNQCEKRMIDMHSLWAVRFLLTKRLFGPILSVHPTVSFNYGIRGD